jgi:type IV pilus assembly protein PilM
MVFNLFRKEESFIAIDIGAWGIKLIELDTSQDPPLLVNIGMVPVKGELFAGNQISKVNEAGEQVQALIEANNIADKRVVTAVPGPSVFTKRLKVPKMSIDELGEHVHFEAANIIPHNINAVRLDYHILGEVGKNHYEVVVAAVKNEILDSFLEAFAAANIEVGVVDVDHFALQNMFEVSYPELVEASIGLVNIGHRYSSINICKGGESLFTGDIPVGGKIFNDAIMDGLGVNAAEAENLKKGKDKNSPYSDMLKDVLGRSTDFVASELNRHLSFFWNASGAQEGIDRILLSGGGSLVPALAQELSEKTGIECSLLNPLRGVECGKDFEESYLKEVGPLMGICVGLGVRYAGDRMLPQDARR